MGISIKDRKSYWRGDIEELNEDGIFEDKVWDRPFIISGTFSEYIPFVNIPQLLPFATEETGIIGTCRLGDSVIQNKYIGAIYLLDENDANNPALPIFYNGDSKLFSPSIRTGDQIRIKCKLLTLDNVWRKILNKESLNYNKEVLPYGLEVLDVDLIKEVRDEFWVDCWYLYKLHITNSEFYDSIQNLYRSEQTEKYIRFKLGDSSVEKWKDEHNIDTPWSELEAIDNISFLGLTLSTISNEDFKKEIQSVFVTKHELCANDNSVWIEFPQDDNVHFQLGTRINVNDINAKDICKKSFSQNGLSYLNSNLLNLAQELDCEGLLPNYCQSLRNLSCSVDFQYDQMDYNINQNIKIKCILKELGIT